VAAFAHERGLATKPHKGNLRKEIAAFMYEPTYAGSADPQESAHREPDSIRPPP
jgi:hypothetical protein